MCVLIRYLAWRTIFLRDVLHNHHKPKTVHPHSCCLNPINVFRGQKNLNTASLLSHHNGFKLNRARMIVAEMIRLKHIHTSIYTHTNTHTRGLEDMNLHPQTPTLESFIQAETWANVFCNLDSGALLANPDFREVMSSYQHLSKDPQNI